MSESLKEWSLRMAKLEVGHEIRAGCFGFADVPEETEMSIRDELNSIAQTLELRWFEHETAAALRDIAARAEAAEAEVERLRQGLWDCFREAGGDTDGDETPGARKSYLVPLAVECVRDLRECYAEAQAECSAAEADARRYRWLRDSDNYPDPDWWNNVISQTTWPYDFDNAIDAELAKDDGQHGLTMHDVVCPLGSPSDLVFGDLEPKP